MTDAPARARWSAFAAAAVTLLLAAMLIMGWTVIGPGNPVYAVVVAAGTFGLAPFIGDPMERLLRANRTAARVFAVGSHEVRLWRLLGVAAFDRLLELSRWNRLIAGRFDGTRAALPAFVRTVRSSMTAHAVGFIVHLVCAAAALAAGHQVSALAIFGLGLPLHFYPAALQRMILWRVQHLPATLRRVR